MAHDGRLDEGTTHQQTSRRHGEGPPVPRGIVTAEFIFKISVFYLHQFKLMGII